MEREREGGMEERRMEGRRERGTEGRDRREEGGGTEGRKREGGRTEGRNEEGGREAGKLDMTIHVHLTNSNIVYFTTGISTAHSSPPNLQLICKAIF